MTKKTYKVEGMDCISCAAMIELDLEDAGIKAKCSFPKQTLEVEFDEGKTDDSKIKETVEASGYRLTV